MRLSAAQQSLLTASITQTFRIWARAILSAPSLWTKLMTCHMMTLTPSFLWLTRLWAALLPALRSTFPTLTLTRCLHLWKQAWISSEQSRQTALRLSPRLRTHLITTLPIIITLSSPLHIRKHISRWLLILIPFFQAQRAFR